MSASEKSSLPSANVFEALRSKSKSIEYAIVDAFSEKPFGGNPAAVVLLSEWKDDEWLQNVAAEFNLSETAYIVKKETRAVRVTESNITESNVIESKVIESNVTESNVSESNVTESNDIESNDTESNVTEFESKDTEPNATELNVTESNVTESNVTESNDTESNVAESKFTESNVREPNITEQNINDQQGSENEDEKFKGDKLNVNEEHEVVDNSRASPESELLVHEYELRWFTPKTEVDLCGHATLASAQVLFNAGIVGKLDTIFFQTTSGLLSVRSIGPESAAQTETDGGRTPTVELIELNFPWITTTPTPASALDALSSTLRNIEVVAVGKASDYLIVELASLKDLGLLKPDFRELVVCDTSGLIATAPGDELSGFDFVSRCFFPKNGIEEDPVTGSAHSILAPYWSTKLQKDDLMAFQASKRGGTLALQVDRKIGRVRIRGQACIIMTGVLTL